MPRTRENNQRIRQAAREKIQAAAMEVFVQKGYHHATMEDIARQAGVSKGLPYNYYKGKEEVLAEMVEGRIAEIRQVMEAAAAWIEPREQLAGIVAGALENVRQRPRAYRFFLNLQTQPEEDRVLARYSLMLNEEVAGQFERQCDIFARMQAPEPRLQSLYFSSCLQGVMLMMSTYPGQIPVEKMQQQLLNDFCPQPLE